MANENKNNEKRPSIEALNDQLTGIEQKVQNNQKVIMWLCIGITAVVLLVFAYMYLIHKPSVNRADDAIGQADTELLAGNDSIALAKYMDVADNYGHDAGNRAALNAAILLYKEGKYEDALKYLNNYDIKDDLIGPAALALQGDCYVNLDKYPEALKAYRAAAAATDNNKEYTPYFMMKEATVLHEMKDYKAEADVYAKIQNEYPRYGMNNRINIEQFELRARKLAEQTEAK